MRKELAGCVREAEVAAVRKLEVGVAEAVDRGRELHQHREVGQRGARRSAGEGDRHLLREGGHVELAVRDGIVRNQGVVWQDQPDRLRVRPDGHGAARGRGNVVDAVAVRDVADLHDAVRGAGHEVVLQHLVSVLPLEYLKVVEIAAEGIAPVAVVPAVDRVALEERHPVHRVERLHRHGVRQVPVALVPEARQHGVAVLDLEEHLVGRGDVVPRLYLAGVVVPPALLFIVVRRHPPEHPAVPRLARAEEELRGGRRRVVRVLRADDRVPLRHVVREDAHPRAGRPRGSADRHRIVERDRAGIRRRRKRPARNGNGGVRGREVRPARSADHCRRVVPGAEVLNGERDGLRDVPVLRRERKRLPVEPPERVASGTPDLERHVGGGRGSEAERHGSSLSLAHGHGLLRGRHGNRRLRDAHAVDAARDVLAETRPGVFRVFVRAHAEVEDAVRIAERRRGTRRGEREELREIDAVRRLPHAVLDGGGGTRALRGDNVHRVVRGEDVVRAHVVAAEVDLHRLHVVVLVDRAERGDRDDVVPLRAEDVENARAELRRMPEPRGPFVAQVVVAAEAEVVDHVLGDARSDVRPRGVLLHELLRVLRLVPAPLLPRLRGEVASARGLAGEAEYVVVEHEERIEAAEDHPRAEDARKGGSRVEHLGLAPVGRAADAVSADEGVALVFGHVPVVGAVALVLEAEPVRDVALRAGGLVRAPVAVRLAAEVAALVGLRLGLAVVPVPLPDVDGREVEASVGELVEVVRRIGAGDPLLLPVPGIGLYREDGTRSAVVVPVAAGLVDPALVQAEVGDMAGDFARRPALDVGCADELEAGREVGRGCRVSTCGGKGDRKHCGERCNETETLRFHTHSCVVLDKKIVL